MMKNILLLYFIFLLFSSCEGQGRQSESRGSEKMNKTNADGHYEEHYSNGNIKLRGFYENGLKSSLWLAYSPEGEVTNAKYYSHDTVVFDNLDVTDFSFTTFKSNKNNIQIQVPKIWDVLDIDSPAILAIRKNGIPRNSFSPNIVIYEYPALTENFDTFMKQAVELQINALSDYKLMLKQSLEIEGRETRRIGYSATIDSIHIGAIETYVIDKNRVIKIICCAENDSLGSFRKYVDMFIFTSNSIQFK